MLRQCKKKGYRGSVDEAFIFRETNKPDLVQIQKQDQDSSNLKRPVEKRKLIWAGISILFCFYMINGRKYT